MRVVNASLLKEISSNQSKDEGIGPGNNSNSPRELYQASLYAPNPIKEVASSQDYLTPTVSGHDCIASRKP